VRWSPQIAEKLAYLASETESSDFQPTTQQVAVHDELKEQAATYRQRLKVLLEQEVTAFNAMLRQRNVPNVVTDFQ
jgi:Tfp pilus assembly protein PilO